MIRPLTPIFLSLLHGPGFVGVDYDVSADEGVDNGGGKRFKYTDKIFEICYKRFNVCGEG